MTRSHRLSTLLLVAGLLCMLYSNVAWFTPARAHPQEQPVRPTLTPVRPTPKPTNHDDHSDSSGAPSGRITGTVIDETTGAPAPNITVTVGDRTVVTDANGNYDRSGLPAGSYTVELNLKPGQGEPGQPPITVKLPAGETVVQHLKFRSPVAPTATPSVPAPIQLPTTGGSAGGEWAALGLGAGLLALGAWMRRRTMTR